MPYELGMSQQTVTQTVASTCSQVAFPYHTGWDLETLTRRQGTTFTLMVKWKGLQLKGMFVRTTMPPEGDDCRCGASAAAAAGPEPRAGQEVMLFLGSPQLQSLAQMRVRPRVCAAPPLIP